MTTAQDLADLVNTALGAGTVKMGNDPDWKVEYIPTGLLPMDILLQGGMPRGRFVEVYGDWSTLKSYIGLNAIRETQREGGIAAVIDTEHSFDPAWAKSVGCNVDDILIERPETGELAFDVAEALIRGKVDFLLFDSIHAAVPQANQKKRLHDESVQPARLAALMSEGLRKLTAANSRTSMMFINQTRVNVGITFGSNETTPGGKAMAFYASYRVNVRKTGKITRDVKFFNGEKWQGGKEQIGQRFKAEVVKSKLSKPFREIWFDWNLEKGQIDLPGFLISQAVEQGVVNIKGNTWSFGSHKAVGREKFKRLVADTPSVLADMESRVRAMHGLPLHVSAIPLPSRRASLSSKSKKTLKRAK